MEFFDKSHRRQAFCINGMIGHSVGFLLPLICYFNRDYTHMHIFIGCLGFLALPVFFKVPESIRWLACNDRAKEAEKIVMVSML